VYALCCTVSVLRTTIGLLMLSACEAVYCDMPLTMVTSVVLYILYTCIGPHDVAALNAPHALAKRASAVAAAAADAAVQLGLSGEYAETVGTDVLESVLTSSAATRTKQKAAGEHALCRLQLHAFLALSLQFDYLLAHCCSASSSSNCSSSSASHACLHCKQ
jgi:hypothetical protein